MARDRFANLASIEVTLSAANALTFQELRTNVGIDADRNKATAMIIDEIDYQFLAADIAQMTTTGDSLNAGITISNSASLLDVTDTRVLNTVSLMRLDLGTAAGGVLFESPIVRQFFPPLIVGERSIFLGAISVGLAAAAVVRCRIYYRVEALTQGEFIELAEVFRLVG